MITETQNITPRKKGLIINSMMIVVHDGDGPCNDLSMAAKLNPTTSTIQYVKENEKQSVL